MERPDTEGLEGGAGHSPTGFREPPAPPKGTDGAEGLLRPLCLMQESPGDVLIIQFPFPEKEEAANASPGPAPRVCRRVRVRVRAKASCPVPSPRTKETLQWKI